MRLLIAFTLLLLISACGQRGDLYLPEPEPDTEQEENENEEENNEENTEEESG